LFNGYLIVFPSGDLLADANSYYFGQISNLPRRHQSLTREQLVPFLGFLSWASLSFAVNSAKRAARSSAGSLKSQFKLAGRRVALNSIVG
jgi:hypothetical protein